MQEYKNVLGNGVIALALVGSVLIASMSFTSVANKKAALEEKRLFNEAVDACSSIGKGVWKDSTTGAEVTEPYVKTYERCMRDKGYELPVRPEVEATGSAVKK